MAQQGWGEWAKILLKSLKVFIRRIGTFLLDAQ
jgi:hypothetical protein